MHSHRLALAVSSLLLACQTGVESTGSTGDTGDDTVGTTTMGEDLACGEAASSLLVDDTCFCTPGTTWVNPFDPSSFECAPLVPRDGECDPVNGAGSPGACVCADYYAWCSVNVDDTDCCYDPAQDPDGSHDPGGDTSTGDASTADSSTGDTDATSTGDTDATSTGADASTDETSSTGDASTDSTGSSSSSGG
jgi:hypothetical protein